MSPATYLRTLYIWNLGGTKTEVFENRVLRRIFVSKRDEETGGWR
jgi:hypothetical protein